METTKVDDLSRAGAGELAAALAARRVSALELFEAAVERIERLDGSINAVVVRDFGRAREAALAADAALARGGRQPLLGVPMTVKEAFNVAGLPTTWGTPSETPFIAPRDAVGVARLKAAGAVILGKTNVPPFLGDWQSDNPVYGRTNHPMDLGRTPGGSSGGGAAALAAGMVPLEFGSDIGGSIRVPSSFCGLFGHKPSYNLVPQRGHAPPGVEGDGVAINVVGPMARSVDDLILALGVLAGPAGDEAVGYRVQLPAPRHERLADFRVLVVDHALAALDSEIRDALHGFADRVESTGAKVSRSSPLVPDLAASQGVYSTILGAVMSRGGPPMGEPLSAHGWMDALDAQIAFRRRWAELFVTFDVVLAPAFGVVAFPHDQRPFSERVHVINGESTPYGAQIAWPAMASLANLPATAIPIARTRAGLPIGIQIIGPYLEDRTTLAFAGLANRAFGQG
ncbi:MAG TPA: amidase family protein [Caulobacteraceae bacterium]